MYRKSRSSKVLLLLLSVFTIAALASGQGNANRESLASVSILDSTKEQDGLMGSVRRVKTESAKLEFKGGKVVEGARQLVELTTYALNGSRIENVSYPVSNTVVGKEEYKYDDKGNIIEMTLRGESGTILSREAYSYEFDRFGNWTKMITSLVVFEDGTLKHEPVEVTYRSLTYYFDDSIATAVNGPARKKPSPAPTSAVPLASTARVDSGSNQLSAPAVSVPDENPAPARNRAAGEKPPSSSGTETAKESARSQLLESEQAKANKPAIEPKQEQPRPSEGSGGAATQPSVSMARNTLTNSGLGSSGNSNETGEVKRTSEPAHRDSLAANPNTPASGSGSAPTTNTEAKETKKLSPSPAPATSNSSNSVKSSETIEAKKPASEIKSSSPPPTAPATTSSNSNLKSGEKIEAKKPPTETKPSPQPSAPAGGNSSNNLKSGEKIEAKKPPTETKPSSPPSAPAAGNSSNIVKSGEKIEAKKPPTETTAASALAMSNYKKGNELFQVGDMKGAVAAYLQAVEAEPGSAEFRLALGHSYLKLQKDKEATKALKEAIKLNPELAEAHYGLGLANFRLDRHKDAADAFKKATTLQPGMAKAHYGLALAYQELGKQDALVEQYRILERLDSNLAKQLSQAFPHFNLPCRVPGKCK